MIKTTGAMIIETVGLLTMGFTDNGNLRFAVNHSGA
jgi:hypothetical protein